MATPNFNIRELNPTDRFTARAFSDGLNKLDLRMGDRVDHIVTGAGAITLTNIGTPTSEVCNFTVRVRDPNSLLGGATALNFPPGMKGRWVVHNLSSVTLNANSGGASVPILAAEVVDVASDGTNMLRLGDSTAGGGGAGGPAVVGIHDSSFFFFDKPADGARIMDIVWLRALTLKAGMPESQGVCAIAPTGATVFDIQRNGASIGSANFAAGATVATFTLGVDVLFVAGDTLEIIAPSPQDATQSNTGFMLHFEK